MTYDLFIGDRTFSSWSLRAWLMFEQFGIPVRTHLLGLYSGTLDADLADLAPARTVPVAKTPDGAVLTDSIAIAETLAEQHPDLGFYPRDSRARAAARSLVAEMHSGFATLRENCPMMLAHAWNRFDLSDALRSDLVRLELLWDTARAHSNGDGPWLFGSYSLADAFYAPVATRIATYNLPVSQLSAGYVATVLADPAFRRWRATGLVKQYTPMPYRLGEGEADWPGPRPLPAEAIQSGTPVNASCPFSGGKIAHLALIDGVTVGFCNTDCREKVVNDAGAWPQVTALLRGR